MPQGRKVVSPDMKREQRVPPGQRRTEGFPVLHYGKTPRVLISEWRFHVWGLVEKELAMDFKEFISLPATTVESDIHCVTGWSRLDNLWEGVSTSLLKDLVDIRPEARFVMVHTVEGFTSNLPLDEFFAEDALFALKHNGQPLTPDHGYPVRLVVPRLYFWKSAKWVEGVEFMATDARGFWERHGYHNHGDPWTEERYSHQE